MEYIQTDNTNCNDSTSTEIQEHNLENCRLCASLMPDNLLLSFCNTVYEEIINNLLPFGLRVAEENDLPTKICRTCIGKLLDVKQIAEGFIEADKKLKDVSQKSNVKVITIKEESPVPEARLHVEKVFIKSDKEVSQPNMHIEMEFKDPLFIKDEEITEAEKSAEQTENKVEFDEKLKDCYDHREMVISNLQGNVHQVQDLEEEAYAGRPTLLLLLTKPASCNNNTTVETSSGTNSHQNATAFSKSVVADKAISTYYSDEDPKYVALRKLLDSDTDAKLVVNAYEKNGCLMPDKARTTIVRAFVRKKKYELLQHYKIGLKFDDWQVDKEEFKYLASEIERIFPTESAATYYKSFKVENGTRIGESGKLLNHFEYAKGKLRSEGIIKPSVKLSERTDTPRRIIILLDQLVKDKLDYLAVNSDDPDTVKKYWLDTHEARQNILQSEVSSVDMYLNRFKALREQLGRELIEKDFELLHPGKGNSLFEKWPFMKQHLLRLLKSVPKFSVFEKSYLDSLPTLPPDCQDAVLFYLLITIVPCGTSKRPRKRKRDSTANEENEENEGPDVENPEQSEVLKSQLRGNGNGSEKRNSYMLSVQIDDEDDASLQNLKKILLSEKLTPHPVILVIGAIDNVRKTYVIINDVWYETNSFLDAVSLTLKAFYVFNCAYPDKAKNVWQFMQFAGFDIRSPFIRVGIKVNAMVKEIDALLKNSQQNS